MAMSAVERRQKTADTLVGIQGFRSKGEEERGCSGSLYKEKKDKGRERAGKQGKTFLQ